MAASENIALFERLIERGFNAGQLGELDAILARDFVEHQFGGEPGIVGVRNLIQGLRTAFPDLHMTVEDIVEGGDKVWARLRCRGTHKGPLFGIPPTGRTIDTMALEVVRVDGGKLVEHWGVPDRFAAMTQLGVLPPPSPGAIPARR
jgi:predicted ester cyclase